MFWSSPDQPNAEPTIFVYGLAEQGHARDRTMVSAHALDAYQQAFLSNHCWMLGDPTSLCEGTVYLEIRRNPDGFFVTPQFVGAEFVRMKPSRARCKAARVVK